MSETRTLKMHSNLLYHTIMRQAGSIAKAVLEGIMNSVDAGASFCDIDLTRESLAVMDDGHGFKDTREIDEFFETFGTPHEEGDATYGTFRMGRGQLFAFGKNEWASGEFKMEVDIKGKGLEYEFTDGQARTDGCVIEIALYDQLSNVDLATNIRDIENMAKYAPITVTLNGVVISVNPATEKWTAETDEAYIRLKENRNLDIYNLGIKVLSLSGWHYGSGGIVVSKQQVKVNYARNDIMSDCKVWKKIRAKVNEMSGNAIEKKPRLNEDEKKRLAMLCYEDNGAWDRIHDKKLITDVSNKSCSTHTLTRLYNHQYTITVAPKCSVVGEKIMKNKLAFVLSEETLDRFNVGSIKELYDLFERGGMPSSYRDRIKIVEFDEIKKQFSSEYRIIDSNRLTFSEEVWISIAHKFPWEWQKQRRYLVGESERADAWTDGKTYIAFNRNYLKRLRYASLQSLSRFGHLLAHEYCHDADDKETDVHGPAFDERFRELVEQDGMVNSFINTALSSIEQILEAKDRKATKALLAIKDKLEGAEEAGKKLTATERRIVETVLETEVAACES